jgi:hypothetical protein
MPAITLSPPLRTRFGSSITDLTQISAVAGNLR